MGVERSDQLSVISNQWELALAGVERSDQLSVISNQWELALAGVVGVISGTRPGGRDWLEKPTNARRA